jgi:hypothetical protein
MVQVTDRALDKLEQMRQMGDLNPDQGIGIGVGQNGDLKFDLMKPGVEDEVIERNGEPLMIIPQPLSDPLAGAVLDYAEGDANRFTLTEAGADEIT